jgi:hypothetical protein
VSVSNSANELTPENVIVNVEALDQIKKGRNFASLVLRLRIE